MIWKPAREWYRSGHIEADTPAGVIVAGPRRSDGGWEFLTPGPGGDWEGCCEAWTREECLHQAEQWAEGVGVYEK